MKIAVIVARLLFGGGFLFFGLNFFFGFVEQPEQSPLAQEFWAGITKGGYFMPLLKWTEVVCGGLILLGLFVPLALIVIAPVVLNIVLYNLFIDTSGVPIALGFLAVQLLLVFAYRQHFLGVLNPFARPAAVKKVDA